MWHKAGQMLILKTVYSDVFLGSHYDNIYFWLIKKIIIEEKILRYAPKMYCFFI